MESFDDFTHRIAEAAVQAEIDTGEHEETLKRHGPTSQSGSPG